MSIDFQDSTPLYVQIVRDIKEKIDGDELKIGEQLQSHKLLAKEYNVSLITIKSALSTLIDEGYLYSRVGKGTFVAKKNGDASITRHSSIGMVLQHLKDPFFSLIAQIVEEKAYTKNFNILLSNSSSQIEKEEGQIKHFRELGVKGLIIATLRKELQAPPIIRKLHNDNFPYVMISYIADADIWYVGTDHELGAYLATKHLIDLGHTKIGYLSPKTNPLDTIRFKGYKKTLEEAGIEYNETFRLSKNTRDTLISYEAGYELGDRFHELDEKPTAYFTYDDTSALGFMKRVQELGYRIPEDLALVGYDDIDQAKYASSPLTTIHQPVEKIGEAAIDKLIKRIEGEKAEVRTLFEPHLVIRESCGAAISSK